MCNYFNNVSETFEVNEYVLNIRNYKKVKKY